MRSLRVFLLLVAFPAIFSYAAQSSDQNILAKLACEADLDGQLKTLVPAGSQVSRFDDGHFGQALHVTEPNGTEYVLKHYRSVTTLEEDLERMEVLSETLRAIEAKGHPLPFRIVEYTRLGPNWIRHPFVKGTSLKKLDESGDASAKALMSQFNKSVDELMDHFKNQGTFKTLIFECLWTVKINGKELSFFVHPGNVIVDPARTHMTIIDGY